MSVGNRGWFSEWDEDQKDTSFTWRPVLQLDGFMVTCQGPWFDSEEACDEFIREDIVGRGMWADA